jgi:hypothetical protein
MRAKYVVTCPNCGRETRFFKGWRTEIIDLMTGEIKTLKCIHYDDGRGCSETMTITKKMLRTRTLGEIKTEW